VNAALLAACDSLDRALAAAVGVVEPGQLERLARLAGEVRVRADLLGNTMVVALAGGTGSGKSSIFNALAREELVPTGPLRPTTSVPAALIPANPEPGLVRWLDRIGIDLRFGQAHLGELAVIDLPDTDSVVVDHRQTVEALLPRLDAVVWVVDPEKYHDRRLHRDFLSVKAAYQGQFLFVLNQVDRIDADARSALIEDLAATLAAEGISDPLILAVAADPPLEGQQGIDELREAMLARWQAKKAVTAKLAVDARTVSKGLGLGGGAFGFEDRWRTVRTQVSGELLSALTGAAMPVSAEEAARRVMSGRATEWSPPPPGPPSAEAVATVHAVIDQVAGFAGPELTRELRSTLGADRVDSELIGALEVARSTAVPVLTPPRWAPWFRRVRWVWFGLIALSAVWAIDRWRQDGPLLGPAIGIVSGLLLWRVGATVLHAATRRLGRHVGEAYAAGAARALEIQLERRLGPSLREPLRRHAGARAAAADLAMAVGSLDRALRNDAL